MEQLSTAQKITQSLRAKGGSLQGSLSTCKLCGSTFVSSHNRGQLYCGRSCSKQSAWAQTSTAERAATLAKMSASMMGKPGHLKGKHHTEETKFLLSQAHKKSGHKPLQRGGNGKTSPCEQMATEMLPSTWVAQFAIPTKQPRGSGYPTAYKADFANFKLKKILEIDGSSHSSRKDLDAKKDTFLASLGWSVYRVSNAEIRSMYTTFKLTGRTTILSKVR